jgi:hypothetical protein
VSDDPKAIGEFVVMALDSRPAQESTPVFFQRAIEFT